MIIEKITLKGEEYTISVEYSSGRRTATASLDGKNIRIRIPSSWKQGEQDRIRENLKNRIIKRIMKGYYGDRSMKEIEFSKGEYSILGKKFILDISENEKKLKGKYASDWNSGETTILISGNKQELEQSRERINSFMRRIVSSMLLSEIEKKTRELNSRYFNCKLNSVRLKDNSSNWGSYSCRGGMNLNFRLVFAPPEILEYVVIHELAHSREKRHNKRFWNLVEKAIPDHRERRKWLRKNAASLFPEKCKSAFQEFEAGVQFKSES